VLQSKFEFLEKQNCNIKFCGLFTSCINYYVGTFFFIELKPENVDFTYHLFHVH